MTYHLARNGQQLGTCTREEAVARYGRGDLLPTDLVWCEGMAEWLPASTVFGSTPPPAAAPQTFTATTASGTTGTPPSTAASVATTIPPRNPDNFLVFSILSTVLCCLPLGIVAIVYSSQVDGKYNSGDYAGAEKAAKNARLWTFISAGITLFAGIAYVISVAVVIATSARY